MTAPMTVVTHGCRILDKKRISSMNRWRRLFFLLPLRMPQQCSRQSFNRLLIDVARDPVEVG